MAAALITPTDWTLMHSAPRVMYVNKVTQNDWIYVPDPGVINPVIQNYIGTVGTFTYGTCKIYNASTAYSASTTSIFVTDVPVNIYTSDTYVVPFYIETTSGEIIQVEANTPTTATSATWTIRRGCFGTTASATGLALSNTVYIKNILKLTDAGTGRTFITYNPMPSDPKCPFIE